MDDDFSSNKDRNPLTEGRPSEGARQPGDPPTIPDHVLIRRIGHGSYGAVWLARNMMGVYRAVKVVYRSSFSDPYPYERELSGIRKFEPISRSHEGFIDILHVGSNEDKGYFYYVMELGDDSSSEQTIDPEKYRPKTLGKELATRSKLPFQECLELGLGLSLALGELHKHGLVHRDVKPANIIFVNGIPKLADIGLVADMNDARSYVGTTGFIPPEGPGTPQADVYGLGKVLYEISTGKDRQEFPALPPDVNQLPDRDSFLELNEVILHACQNEREKRYQSAWELHADLLVLANGKSVKRLKALERRLSQFKRAAALSFAILAAAAIVSYQIYREWKLRDEAHHRQVGASIAYGNKAVESGDLLGALPYFADALQLDEKNPERSLEDRLRFGSALAQCPKLTFLDFDESPLVDGQISPDGKRFLVAQFSRKAKIYDLTTGKWYSHPFGQQQLLVSAAFSHDGKFVVTASEDGSAVIWDSSSLEEVHRYQDAAALFLARFSPDDTQLVTACEDGFARIWNINTGKAEHEFKHLKGVRFADFSRDGKFLITGSADGRAQVWNARTGQAVGKPFNHPSWVIYAAFSPDGKRVITCCSDHRARVWDIAAGVQVSPDLIHRDAVSSAEFSPDGLLIITASWDGSVRLWEADHFQPIKSSPVLRHADKVNHASFAPDGHRILTMCEDGSIRIWDLAGSSFPSLCPEHAFTMDGSRSLKKTNNIVEVQATFFPELQPVFLSPKGQLKDADFNRNGLFIVTTSVETTAPNTSNSLVQVWDAKTGVAQAPPLIITNDIKGATTSDNGSQIVVYWENKAQSWDVAKRTPTAAPVVHDSAVTYALVSPSGGEVATAAGKNVHVWNILDGQELFSPLEHIQAVNHVEFSPDGHRLVSCCTDAGFTKCYAQVWDAKTGKPAGPQLKHGDGVLFATFSPDGTRVATASEDFTAKVWDCATGRQLTVPALQHDEKVTHIVFSPDGKWVLTASFDGSSRVWSAETGEPLTPWLRHMESLTNAQFLADGRYIVTFDRKGNVWKWELPVIARSTTDLRQLARLLSGDMLASTGQLAPRKEEPLSMIWQQLENKYPSDFIVSDTEGTNWEEWQEREGETKGDTIAAAFHIQQMLSVRPDNTGLSARISPPKRTATGTH